ncbi:MAG: LPS assembly protein LptD [Desulfobacterales bacterium]|nr:LPS assembly protein LptD [Desulfobacterales bacterium]
MRKRYLANSFLIRALLAPLLISAGLALLAPDSGRSEEMANQPWEIVADQLTYSKEPQEVYARGHVIVTPMSRDKIRPIVIKADEIDYNIKQGLIKARGNIELSTATDRINADQAEIELDSRTGFFLNATLFHAENNAYIQGRRLEKTGELTYRISDGRFTTCDPDPKSPLPWSIGSSDAGITKDGYALLRNATFRIRGVPVFYSPFLIVPAKTERQSGLLFPELSNSAREGQGVLVPLFVNLSPSSDATLYGGKLTRRGVQAGAEFRHVADLDSRGMFSASYLRDSLVDTVGNDFNSDGFLRTREDRYWIRAKADHYFSNGLIGRVDLDLVSDRDYLREFQAGMTGFTQSDQEYFTAFQRGFQDETELFRENTAQLSRNWDSMGLYGELRAIDDNSPGTNAATPLRSLPRISSAGIMSLAGSPVDLSWQSEYVYYVRDNGLGGHRLDLAPRLIVPLHPLAPLFEATLSTGLRETLYLVETNGNTGWSGNTGQGRTLYDLSASLATTLRQDFVRGKAAAGRTLIHTVRPYLDYSYLPDVNQSSLPRFDPSDRINAANKLTYGMSHYFRSRTRLGNRSESRDSAYLNIEQSYDFRAGDRPYSDVSAKLELTPLPELKFNGKTAVSVYGGGVTYYDLTGVYTNSHGDTILADYYYKKDTGIEELTAGIKARVSNALSAQYDVVHSFANNVGAVSTSMRLIYQPSCWGMILSGTRSSDDFRVMLTFTLTGIGKALELGRSL